MYRCEGDTYIYRETLTANLSHSGEKCSDGAWAWVHHQSTTAPSSLVGKTTQRTLQASVDFISIDSANSPSFCGLHLNQLQSQDTLQCQHLFEYVLAPPGTCVDASTPLQVYCRLPCGSTKMLYNLRQGNPGRLLSEILVAFRRAITIPIGYVMQLLHPGCAWWIKTS